MSEGGPVAPEGFDVRYETVQRLAEQFERRAERMREQVARFDEEATGHAETFVAFGLLGECTDAADKYRTMAGRTREALSEVADAVGADAVRLTDTVDEYRTVDGLVERALAQLTLPDDDAGPEGTS